MPYLSDLNIWVYMSSGDMFDVIDFNYSQDKNFEPAPVDDHCSGLIRIYNDTIYVSHTSWVIYGAMTRVSKIYNFKLDHAATTVKFSSYPGFSYSFDDWYITSNGVAWFETSTPLWNSSLYALC